MVYEIKCVECGKIIDFGGHKPEKLPEDALEFNGNIYCRECVKEFVEFGTGDILERVRGLEDKMEDMRDELGIEKHQ